ncbi:MAG: SNF2-related protein, partial [Akkermansiaceae bacterium]
MEITEQWIGKAAGGRVLKEARALVKLGKVVQVKRTGGVFQGVVGKGKRPMRLVVKVSGPTDVKNHCGCAMSRATGALCEHAAALMIAGIRAQEVEVDTPAPEPVKIPVVAMEVNLSPQFPTGRAGGVHLKLASTTDATPADENFCQWLFQTAGVVEPAMLMLDDRQLSAFLYAVAGHPRLFRKGERCHVQRATIRPLLEMEVDGEEAWLKLPDDSELFLMAGVWALWDEEQSRLMIHDEQSPLQEDLVAGDWFQLETAEMIAQLRVLQHAYQLPSDLGGVSLREASPDVILEIAGSTRALQARLSVDYGGNIYPLGTQNATRSVTPYACGETEGLWFVRNEAAEQSAISELMSCGFQILDASGFLFLRGEEEVLEFLTVNLPSLRERWEVDTEAKLRRVEIKTARIVPHITVQGSGEDWLSCEVTWQCKGASLDPAAVRRMLQSGSRTVSLPQGGKAVLSQYDSDVMDGFLLDTDPQQEAGGYKFSKLQQGYLETLQSHYSGEKSNREEVTVPALPSHLQGILRPYQLEGVRWLYRSISSTGGALLADDMGLGKTLQTLAFLKLWKQQHASKTHRPFVIVCPATLLGNWRDEAEKFIPDLTVLVMHGAKRKDYYEVMASADIVITSYALLDKDSAHYQKIEPAALVLDEASAIRNPDTLAAKAARKIKTPVRIAITGTPVENTVRDLWSVFQFLLPGYLGGREDFRQRYELPCQAEQPDTSALARLRWRTAPHMLRRTKSLVAKDLPPKLESTIWCELSATQKEHYQSIQRRGAEKVDLLRKQSGKESARMQMLTILLRLRQSCCDMRLLDKEMEKLSLMEASAKLTRLMELLGEA